MSQGALLTRSLEQLLRPLIRILVGRITLTSFVGLVRKIYVQESEKKLKDENPKNRIKLTQLALLTGLDTRTINKLMNSSGYSIPSHEDEEFLHGLTIEGQVIRLWTSHPQFADMSTGEPRELLLEDSKKGFPKLVALATTSRGVTNQSILARLVKGGTAEIDQSNRSIRLVTNNFYPFISNDESGMLDVGLHTITLLLETVENNLRSAKTGGPKFFQRSSYCLHLPVARVSELRPIMSDLMLESDKKAREVLAEFECETANPEEVIAGISLFYFESKQNQ